VRRNGGRKKWAGRIGALVFFPCSCYLGINERFVGLKHFRCKSTVIEVDDIIARRRELLCYYRLYLALSLAANRR
jgi:hypothetical protein